MSRHPEITHLTRPRPDREALIDDVRQGLTGSSKHLPPVYFYDARGSELFEQITELEEYYPTRAETRLLRAHADEFMATLQPEELVELGSGSSTKTTLLLAALHRTGGTRYAALEISPSALEEALDRLDRAHSWLEVEGYVGDFHTDLGRIPRRGPRLVAFLGSTVGNLRPPDRPAFLRGLADALDPDDGLLLGIDLVKDPSVLLPAYDDREGVTAAFNRNVLHRINRELGADIPVDAFAHRAVWDPICECVEMHLVARGDVQARIPAADMELSVAHGEHIVTEHSCKFRLETLEQELSTVGLRVAHTAVDEEDAFAVVVATPTAR